jgi:DNA polymerase III epsilon subunit-like protein
MVPERLVFVDLETTGLEPWRPVMQIAAVAVARNLAELESFEAKIKFPKRWADPAALRKVHYSPALWRRDAKPARLVAESFAAFLTRHATVDMISANGMPFRVAQVVAHNAAFDGAFLRNWFDRLGLFFPGHFRMLCTVQRAIWLFQEDLSLTPPEDYKLGTLCQYFGVRLPPEEAHDALNDVRATVKLYR